MSGALKLGVYTRKGGRLVFNRHTPKHTAYEMNLYTIQALPEAERQVVEKGGDEQVRG
jgi:hypothetical protein